MLKDLQKNIFGNGFGVAAFSIVLAFLPFLWIPSGYMINSEDQGFMNYEKLLNVARFSWVSKFAYGDVASPVDHSLIMPVGMFYFLAEHAGASNDFAQKSYISACIVTIFVSFMVFSRIFTRDARIAIASFCIYFFNFYVQYAFAYPAKTYQFILMPLAFYLVYEYLKTGNKKFIAINCIMLFVLQGIFTNISQAAAAFSAYILGILFFCINKKEPGGVIKKLTYFFISAVPIIAYQLMVWGLLTASVYGKIGDISSFEPFHSLLSEIFQGRGVWWEGESFKGVLYNNWFFYYSGPFAIIASFILLIFVLSSCMMAKFKMRTAFWIVVLLFFWGFTSGFSFFPDLYRFIMDHVPFFEMFREPWAKIMPLSIMAFSVLTMYALNAFSKNKRFDLIYVIFVSLAIFRGVPFFTSDFYERNKEYKQTFVEPTDYWWKYSEWTKSLDDKNIFPVPYAKDNLDYEYEWHDDEIGNTNTEMPSVFGYTNVFSKNNFLDSDEVLGTFLARKSFDFIKLGKVNYVLSQKDIKILDNDDEYSWQEAGIKEFVDNDPIVTFGNKLFVYKVKRDYFLPHFYTPEQAGVTGRPLDELPEILASDDWKTRSAVFFKSQNQGKDEALAKIADAEDQGAGNLPTLEFRKINPTKYRVRIHAAQGEFPLVFSESFHDGWKAYLEKASAPDTDKLSADGYRVLDGNSDDQASADELKDYVSKGWVTDLGNGNEKTIEHKKWEDGKEKKDYDEKCRIGFVSKDFQGTIQNDNLLGGSVFETWLKKPIDPADHLKANGYANAWLIDPEALCQGSGKCVRNPDGSYDMEIVVEFWPQRLFYIGLAVSGTTILSCLGYLAWDHRRRKREESAA